MVSLMVGQAVGKMLSYLERFPGLLAPCLPPLHCLLGHYCHCMGSFREAVLHFQTAKVLLPLLSTTDRHKG